MTFELEACVHLGEGNRLSMREESKMTTKQPGDEALAQILGHIATLTHAVQALEATTNATKQKLDAVDGRIEALEATTNATRQKLDAVDGRIEALEAATKATKQHLDAMQAPPTWADRAKASYPNGPPTDVISRATGESITGAGTRSRGQAGYLRR
jgi:chromosome segregation ATPase